ncbi:hypothetical protein F2P81_015881 [Scophthalmus maximus]|uniref:Uncharacterized protein n=1 Tax=Scophthalmus maximus TaxID=52904 RepID=A0A6A4S7Z6_SCOMX|nr:hypothetical protein F2P81_015881 [Scophthalmus maximus]
MRYTFQDWSSEVVNNDFTFQSWKGFKHIHTFCLMVGPVVTCQPEFNSASPRSRSSCEPTGPCDGLNVLLKQIRDNHFVVTDRPGGGPWNHTLITDLSVRDLAASAAYTHTELDAKPLFMSIHSSTFDRYENLGQK